MYIEKYNIIYADPPWRYHSPNRKNFTRGPELHYNTMTTQDICDLPVKNIANESCILFLWATFPKLPDAFTVIKAWGFRFKTVGFVWIKKNRRADSLFFGMGAWTRSNAEICLIGIKGKPKRISAGVHQVIISPVEAHSKKPDVVRERIVRLMGDLPRVELFARQAAPGWDVWGNEVQSDISL